ncbi:MAG: prepilin-type N-terminal cleavage/methylation domain-containing protein [Planctomycetota bacterium]|jgi:general secretion pathway protein G
MVTRNERQHGFTLVEILIVVVILGILAAVVIPQFADASTSAKTSSLTTQLQTIRSQLELYQIEHNGNYPTIAQLQADFGVMTSPTDVDGTINAAGLYGPYLQKAPANPFNNSSTVAAAYIAGVGWVYDEGTGSFSAGGFDEATNTFTP